MRRTGLERAALSSQYEAFEIGKALGTTDCDDPVSRLYPGGASGGPPLAVVEDTADDHPALEVRPPGTVVSECLVINARGDATSSTTSASTP